MVGKTGSRDVDAAPSLMLVSMASAQRVILAH